MGFSAGVGGAQDEAGRADGTEAHGGYGNQSSVTDWDQPFEPADLVHGGCKCKGTVKLLKCNRDPLGFSAGINPFVSVGNNPIKRVDPYGNEWFEVSQDEWDAAAAVVNDRWTGWVDKSGSQLGFCSDSVMQERYGLMQMRNDEAGGDENAQYFTTVAHGMVVVLKESAKLTPINSFSEAVFGESVDGEKVSGAARGVAAASVLFGAVKCAMKGGRLALGLRKHGLRDFASKVGADHLGNLQIDQAKPEFLKALKDPEKKFLLNLDGMGNPGDSVEGILRRSLKEPQGYTDWEIGMLDEAGRLGEVELLLNGQRVLNPFK